MTAFLHSKEIELDRSNIEACHSFLRRIKTDKPAIITRFANRKHKPESLKQGRQSKGTDVYLNKHLTKKNVPVFLNCSCGSVVEHYVSSAKVVGSIPTGTHILTKNV